MRWVAQLLVLLAVAAPAFATSLDTAATIMLENDVLKVELYADRPAPLCYLYKPTGVRMTGSGPDGVWRINGQSLPWARWRVIPFRRSDGTAAAYEMVLSGTPLRLQARFVLRRNALEMRLENVQDPAGMLRTLEWVGMPMLVCRDPAWTYWREVWQDGKWRSDARRVWHCRPDTRQIGAARPDPAGRPTLHACIFQPEKFCAFVESNSRLFPLRDRLIQLNDASNSADAYALSPNTYYNCGQPLRARVVFMQDANGDGTCDQNDYALWMSRHLPGPPDNRFKTAVWYKFEAADPAALLDVVRRLENLTAGMPQVCGLTGRAAGTVGKERLADLVIEARRHNATISCQTRFSETLPGPPGEGALASLDSGGNLPESVLRRVGGVSGEDSPSLALHLASFRADAEQNVRDQMYGGILPLLGDLGRHNVSVTAENTGGLPAEMAGMFSALWRFEPVPELLPMYHGNVIAGCPLESAGNSFGYGCAVEIPRRAGGDIDWPGLLDQVYLRAMLYHFYLEREWLDTERLPNGATRIQFTRATTVIAGPERDHLKVQAGDVIVADGADRFIPRGGAIYAYSRDGSNRWWKLPPGWAGRPLEVRTLAPDGPLPSQEAKTRKGRVRLRLEAHTPVIITARATAD